MSGRRYFAVALLVAAASCSDDTGAGAAPGPCDVADPPAQCSASCTADQECSADFYCGAAGSCTADCSPGGSECGDGSHCAEKGRCVIDFTGGTGCPDVQVTLTPVIPHVMLLIDRSGSMDDPFGRIGGQSVDRWAAVKYALTDPNRGAVTKLQDRVRFGASLYHSNGGNAGGTCPILERSGGTPPGQPALDNRPAIAKLMDDFKPTADTPTAESVDAIVADMKQWAQGGPDASHAPRVLILATDGNPDNCADADAHDATSQKMSEAAVQRAHAAGIQTRVLSVGADVSKQHLEKLANAGVGKPLSPADAPFYRGNNPDELVAAFDEIIRGVRSCVFTLNGRVETQHASSGTVKLNDQTLQHETDWVLKDPTTMEILGQACKTFLDQDTVSLSAKFPCGRVIL